MHERELEMAARFVEAARARAVAGVCATVASQGRAICLDCGDEIEPARRAAAPFAERCLDCQQVHEGGQ